ncbi:MAG: hypothetical protein HYT64_00495 [Candidatus Yanofskybacteria bacterium]|nr:hypothetical protein [Candidatus Yanofskybacteria bacterium]
MNKYIITGKHTEYLNEVEVMARNEQDAKDMASDLWNAGVLVVANSETEWKAKKA